MGNLLPTIYHIWNVFVTSNLFNFVVFIAIFAWIFKKFDLKGMLTGLQKKVSDLIEAAKREKAEATQELKKAETAVANLETELTVIVKEAQKSAEFISDKILKEAAAQIESIESNAVKVIDAEEKLLVSTLSKSASKASIAVAKSHIEKVLAETPTLQEKYINESIDELDRLNF